MEIPDLSRPDDSPGNGVVEIRVPEQGREPSVGVSPSVYNRDESMTKNEPIP